MVTVIAGHEHGLQIWPLDRRSSQPAVRGEAAAHLCAACGHGGRLLPSLGFLVDRWTHHSSREDQGVGGSDQSLVLLWHLAVFLLLFFGAVA